MTFVKLNEVNINAFNLEENEIEDDGKNLKELSFSFETRGENEYHLFKNLLSQDEFDVIISDLEFKAKITKWSYSLNDNNETNVQFRVTLKEINPDEKQWSLETGTRATAIQSMLRIDMLEEILIQKGIATKEDFKEVFKKVMDQNYQKHFNYLFTGDENNNKFFEQKDEE